MFIVPAGDSWNANLLCKLNHLPNSVFSAKLRNYEYSAIINLPIKTKLSKNG